MSADVCEVCGQYDGHLIHCYIGFDRESAAEDDYFEALFASEPAEDVAA